MQLKCKDNQITTELSSRTDARGACSQTRIQSLISWTIAGAIITLAIFASFNLWQRMDEGKAAAKPVGKQVSDPKFIELAAGSSPLSAIKLFQIKREIPNKSIVVTGSIEANSKQIQQVTPLVTGRIRDVMVSTGQLVKKGDLLVVIESPQVAELHGKLHEAESKAQLANGDLSRVLQAANQVNILKAKARLDEADATLSRNRQLNAEGLLAGKDLIAAESEWRQAQAEYEFQKNISLNGEIARAKSELSTQNTEVEHLRDGLRSLDANVEPKMDLQDHDISRIELRAPISGLVIERFVNPGSGTELGKPLLTLADTSSLWVIANVPEQQLIDLKNGMLARVMVNGKTVTGTVDYIDPRISADTRTARVRIAIKNASSEYSIGAFAQVEFTVKDNDPKAKFFIPETAVQDINGIKSVFAKTSTGSFRMQTVETGARRGTMIPIYRGLSEGEQIVTNGSFLLKSTALKDQFGGSD